MEDWRWSPVCWNVDAGENIVNEISEKQNRKSGKISRISWAVRERSACLQKSTIEAWGWSLLCWNVDAGENIVNEIQEKAIQKKWEN